MFRSGGIRTGEGHHATQAVVAAQDTAIASEQMTMSRELLLDMFYNSIQRSQATRNAYRKSIKAFYTWLDRAGKNLFALRHDDLAAYVRSFETNHLSPSTSNLYICALKVFYSWIEDNGGKNIAYSLKSVRSNNTDRFSKQPLTQEQAVALLTHFRDLTQRKTTAQRGLTAMRNYAIATLLLHCGLRSVEITRLRFCDLTRRRGVRVLMIQGKGHVTADTPIALTDSVNEVLQSYLALRGRMKENEPMFAANAYIGSEDFMSPRTVQHIVKKGLRAIGIDDSSITTHSLRHTAAETMIAHGAALIDVQMALRHTNPATTEIYLKQIMSENRLKNPATGILDKCFDIEQQ